MFRAGQPLYWFALISVGLARRAGCEAHQASTFLLTDTPYTLPWTRIDTRAHSGVIDLRIGNPSVPVRDVQRAYVDAVRRLKAEQPEIFAAKKRRSRDRTLALLEFVEEYRPGAKSPADWRWLKATWRDEQPGLKSFPTPEAMREAYRRAAKDRDRGTAE